MNKPRPPAGPPKPKEMPRPPQKEEPARPPKDELAEVERALSVLGGHHPEHERAQREVREAIEKKKKSQASIHLEHSHVSRKRVLAFAAGAAAVLALLGAAYARHAKVAAIESALEGPTKELEPRGFMAFATGDGRLDEAIEPGCFAAVSPKGKLEVEHGGETLAGEGSVGFCACTPERVSVKADGPVRLLRVDGKAVGNLAGLAAAEPRPRVLSKRVEECAEGQLDAWLGENKPPSAPIDPELLNKDAALEPLASAGFAPVATIPAGRAFTVLEGESDSCFLAWSTVADDTLTLRVSGGDRPLSGTGPLGWCAEKAQVVTMWREGAGEAVVARAKASRTGGMLGLRERVQRVPRFRTLSAWVTTEGLGWDAASALRASAVGEVSVALSGTETQSHESADARLVSISMLPGGSYSGDRRQIPFHCQATAETGQREAICAEVSAQEWRQTGALGAIAIAQAPLPFWLAVLADVKDPEVTKQLVRLLAVARRLHGDGFEPTTLAGVVEETSGVTVTGRGGDDAVVAIGLGPAAPWVFPYSDGQEWKLTEAPRVVSLKPGERVLLSSAEAPPVPKEKRRTVVFRRPKTK